LEFGVPTGEIIPAKDFMLGVGLRLNLKGAIRVLGNPWLGSVLGGRAFWNPKRF